MLEIVFWFSQVLGLILMLLKNLSYLFKAFDQSGDLNFFFFSSTPICFCLFYIILSICKESEWLEATVFMVCLTCIVSSAVLFLFLMHKVTVVLLHYF